MTLTDLKPARLPRGGARTALAVTAAAALAVTGVAGFSLASAQTSTTVDLGTAGDYAVLAGGPVTNRGASTVTGDVGGASTAGFDAARVTNGTLRTGDATTAAQTALAAADD